MREDLAEKQLGAVVLGVGEEFLGRAALDDLAAVMNTIVSAAGRFCRKQNSGRSDECVETSGCKWVREHTRLSVRPPRWQAEDRGGGTGAADDLLLRGDGWPGRQSMVARREGQRTGDHRTADVISDGKRRESRSPARSGTRKTRRA